MEPEPQDSESQVRVEIGKPISFEGIPRSGDPDPVLSRIVDALLAYRRAVEALVQGKYAAVAHHFRRTFAAQTSSYCNAMTA